MDFNHEMFHWANLLLLKPFYTEKNGNHFDYSILNYYLLSLHFVLSFLAFCGMQDNLHKSGT